MRNLAIIFVFVITAAFFFQIQPSTAHPNEGESTPGKSLVHKEPRQDDEDELTPPPLLPSVVQVLGAALRLNDTTVNRTIERLTLSHNGIDPDLPTTTEKITTKDDADEEEEEEEESNDAKI